MLGQTDQRLFAICQRLQTDEQQIGDHQKAKGCDHRRGVAQPRHGCASEGSNGHCCHYGRDNREPKAVVGLLDEIGHRGQLKALHSNRQSEPAGDIGAYAQEHHMAQRENPGRTGKQAQTDPGYHIDTAELQQSVTGQIERMDHDQNSAQPNHHDNDRKNSLPRSSVQRKARARHRQRLIVFRVVQRFQPRMNAGSRTKNGFHPKRFVGASLWPVVSDARVCASARSTIAAAMQQPHISTYLDHNGGPGIARRTTGKETEAATQFDQFLDQLDHQPHTRGALRMTKNQG